MSPEGTKRKLTAILSADVKGYSRLMEDDEEATVATLTTYKRVMTEVIEKHRGRVVDAPGDNLLAEFASVVDAMRGAVEIQEELRARNSELPDHRRMEFRVGINLGDVIEEDGRIYGDGVNIAARVESLADAGGICLSESAYQQVKNKLSLGIEFLGQHEVKNISEPVPVYRLVMEPGAAKTPTQSSKKTQPSSWKRWAVPAIPAIMVAVVAVALWQVYLRPKTAAVDPASIERMAFPLPEKPSIAVLPFANLSGDPGQEYLADGISENIIAALAKIPEMFVIARNSTFSYKGKSPKVQQVAEELGVQHVLEGSVQRSGDRIRVTAQLIDALTGHHIWAEMYDRRTDDLFDLLDGITMEILVALQVQLTEGDQARVRQDTDSLEALGYWVQAQPLWDRMTKGDHAKARVLLEKAVAVDPEYVSAWARLGHLHYTAARFAGYGWSDSREESVRRTEELARKALAMDPSHPEANAVMGHAHLLRREHDEAVTWFRKAADFGPNDADVQAYLAIVLRWTGEPGESIQLFQQAMRLQPAYPWWYLLQLGRSYREAGRYEEAIATMEQLLDPRWGDRPPQKKLLVHIVSASCYAFLGRLEEARAQVAEWENIDPKLSMEGVTQYIRTAEYFQDAAYEQRLIDSWRKAGVPEHPALPLPDKPSIAVLPFVNMSEDPKQEYFSDGITEQIITSISKIPRLFVISRTSSFKYKGQAVDIKQVGRELGVKYVLEGSIQRSGDRLRITAQLIDAITGKHLWAERYDRNIRDIFALQDEITMEIMRSLSMKLTDGERVRLGRGRTDNLKAFEKALEGVTYLRAFNRESNPTARQLAEEAIALDPEYACWLWHMLWMCTSAQASPLASLWGRPLNWRKRPSLLATLKRTPIWAMFMHCRGSMRRPLPRESRQLTSIPTPILPLCGWP
jgi:TolB-like protein/class 3 adenylate cyclase/cytochrome c-type biogenesis protein CcmH/NrfG